MNWFNINKLEEDISNDNLSEKDGFNYLLAYFILSTIAIVGGNDEMSWRVQLLDIVIQIIIIIWAFNAIYNINLEIDGKDFFRRFFAISWVIGMRAVVVLLILFVIARIILRTLSENSSTLSFESNPIFDYILVIFFSLFSIIVSLLIMKSFRNLKPKTQ